MALQTSLASAVLDSSLLERRTAKEIIDQLMPYLHTDTVWCAAVGTHG